MFKVEIQPNWQLQSLDGESVVQRLIDLLVGISEDGSLAKGLYARAAFVSLCMGNSAQRAEDPRRATGRIHARQRRETHCARRKTRLGE